MQKEKKEEKKTSKQTEKCNGTTANNSPKQQQQNGIEIEINCENLVQQQIRPRPSWWALSTQHGKKLLKLSMKTFSTLIAHAIDSGLVRGVVGATKRGGDSTLLSEWTSPVLLLGCILFQNAHSRELLRQTCHKVNEKCLLCSDFVPLCHTIFACSSYCSCSRSKLIYFLLRILI